MVHQMLMTTPSGILLIDREITRSPASGNVAGFGFRGDGKMIVYGNGESDWIVDIGDWIETGNVADYEVKYYATTTPLLFFENPNIDQPNSPEGNAENVWHRMGEGQDINGNYDHPRFYTSTNPLSNFDIVVEIRSYATQDVVGRFTVTLPPATT